MRSFWVALGPEDDPPPPIGGDGTPLYESDAIVLESPERGAELCFGANDSYSPQCSGISISNWNWGMVEGEESASGTTWGQFHVVGRYDGTEFMVTDAGPYRQPSPDY